VVARHIVACVALGLAAAGWGAPALAVEGRLFTADPPGTFALPTIGPAPDFVVRDAVSDEPIRLSGLSGKVVVLTFFYTRCADGNACPLTTSVLRGVQTALGERRLVDKVRLLSVSFDDARDTPVALRSYRDAAGADELWRFARPETRDARDAILAAYDQRVVARADGSLTHPMRVYLVDGERRLRQIYSQSWLHTDVLLSDIETLLLEAAPNSPVHSAATP
jgi:cytochrome c peroxidase